MTKFEWERQLKKGVSSLPKSEQQRVFEYYNELFSDKIDAGMQEQEIIAEFGNPFDVANKILVDFYSEEKGNAQADEYVFSDAEAFEEERPKQQPTADNAAQRQREERRNERRSARIEVRQNIRADAHKKNNSANGLIVLICVLLFFVLGAFFNKWHPAWMLFVAMPMVISLVEAIEKRNWRIFCYPLLVVLLYLSCGFYLHAWHPMWVLFLTIPLYYVIGDYVSKKTRTQYVEQTEFVPQQNPSAPAKDAPRAEQSKPTKKSAGKIFAGIVLTVILVWIMIVVWSTVISLFVSGIAMLGGGVAAIAWSILNWTADRTMALMTLGASLAVLGLGLVFTFGMASVFKYCAKMCKSFGRSISACFK